MKPIRFDRENLYQLRALQTAFSKKIKLVTEFAHERSLSPFVLLALEQMNIIFCGLDNEIKILVENINRTCRDSDCYNEEIQTTGEKLIELIDRLFNRLDQFVDLYNLGNLFKQFQDSEFCLLKDDEIWEPFQTLF